MSGYAVPQEMLPGEERPPKATAHTLALGVNQVLCPHCFLKQREATVGGRRPPDKTGVLPQRLFKRNQE